MIDSLTMYPDARRKVEIKMLARSMPPSFEGPARVRRSSQTSWSRNSSTGPPTQSFRYAESTSLSRLRSCCRSVATKTPLASSEASSYPNCEEHTCNLATGRASNFRSRHNR